MEQLLAYAQGMINGLQSAVPDESGLIRITTDARDAMIGRVNELMRNLESLNEKQKWIPCSERLPEKCGWRLVYVDGQCYLTDEQTGERVPLGYCKVRWFDTECGWMEDEKYITHWMPLPEAPVKDK